jgi:ABC-type uncharacterized transport system involved in gliding motility auxiliary subunit
VTDPHPLKAYYLVGHGDRTLDSETASDGFSQFVDLLKQKNIDVQPLLLRTNDIPDDCQLLILAGPRMPIPTDELQRVRRYLDNGGRALILTLSPVRQDVRRTGLEQLLTEWNVLVGDDLVIDPKLARSDAPQFLMTDFFGNHPIMHPLQGTRLGLVMPNSVRERSRSDRTGSPIHVTELIFTSPAGTSVSNFRGTAETNGVIPLAVAVEKGAIAGVDTTRGTSRMVVVGEANFLGNAVLDFEGNRDFAMLAVNWLLDRRQLLAIGPRPIREYRISLTRPQIRTAGWILLGAMPGSVLLLGFLVWLRRRK